MISCSFSLLLVLDIFTLRHETIWLKVHFYTFPQMMLSLFACAVLLLYPVSLGSPTAHAHLNEIKDLIIHEADMDDIGEKFCSLAS